MLKEYQKMLNDALDSFDHELFYTIRNNLIGFAEENMPVLAMGNGGSSDIADHWACDHTKGVNCDTLLFANVRNLSCNMSLVTAIGNDLGYDQIFSKQIEWVQDHAAVIAISSSGSSPNIVNGLRTANAKGYPTIAFVGFDGGIIVKEDLADFIIHVKSNNYGVVEDCHQIIMHTLAQDIRKTYATNPDNIKL
jgi:D-sedoheptulose 7-phosphate isomerase